LGGVSANMRSGRWTLRYSSEAGGLVRGQEAMLARFSEALIRMWRFVSSKVAIVFTALSFVVT
jgi:hypothetical protein